MSSYDIIYLTTIFLAFLLCLLMFVSFDDLYQRMVNGCCLIGITPTRESLRLKHPHLLLLLHTYLQMLMN